MNNEIVESQSFREFGPETLRRVNRMNRWSSDWGTILDTQQQTDRSTIGQLQMDATSRTMKPVRLQNPQLMIRLTEIFNHYSIVPLGNHSTETWLDYPTFLPDNPQQNYGVHGEVLSINFHNESHDVNSHIKARWLNVVSIRSEFPIEIIWNTSIVLRSQQADG